MHCWCFGMKLRVDDGAAEADDISLVVCGVDEVRTLR